jgi:hypothetical protein
MRITAVCKRAVEAPDNGLLAPSWRQASLAWVRNACHPARMKSVQLEGNTLTADPVRHGVTERTDDKCYSSIVSRTRAVMTAGSSSKANNTVRSKPCGPVITTRTSLRNGSAAIHPSYCSLTCLPRASQQTQSARGVWQGFPWRRRPTEAPTILCTDGAGHGCLAISALIVPLLFLREAANDCVGIGQVPESLDGGAVQETSDMLHISEQRMSLAAPVLARSIRTF